MPSRRSPKVVEVTRHADTLRPVNLLLGDWVEGERDRIVATLCDWLRIPSISAHPDRAADVRRSAEFTADLLTDAGLEHVAVLETAGLPVGLRRPSPRRPRRPTVLVYGHHDVQPVDPLEEWTSPPFEPVLVDGELRGRGAIDDKGQTMFQIEAVRGLLAGGGLPVNVKFLVEGEEEVGSPNFEALLEAERERLACDVVVVSDTDMWAPDVPSVCVGMRGLIAFGVDGAHGAGRPALGPVRRRGAQPGPPVARMVAALHDDDGAGSPSPASTTTSAR